jgi:simple sugar transport system permease protein
MTVETLRRRVFKISWKPFLQPVLAVAAGLALGLIVTTIAGEKPWHILQVLANGAFGSGYDFGMTLFFATPLVFTGLSVALGLQAGLFNVGAEGQMIMGAMAASATGILLPNVPWPLAPALALIAAFASGGAWGAIPGWLRARRGSHEVINTIMLNFVAVGITSWMTLYLFKNPDSQNPETRAIGAGYILSHLQIFGDAPVSTAIFVALAVVALVWFFMRKTVLGYELRAVGTNESAARAGGIDPGRMRILAMTLSGGVAGLVAASEVLGSSYRFKMGFSPGYGFIGIAVALLGRGNPFGIFAAALLFGALHKGSLDLDFETDNVSQDLSMVLQALIILAVAADGLWSWKRRTKR